jgi:hypothetical protein
MSDGSAIVYCANLPRAFSDEVWNGLLLRVRPDGAVFETWATNGKLPITAAPPGATQLPKSYSHSVSAFREAPGGALSIAIIDGAHHREVEWTARLTPSGIFDNVYGDGGSAPTDRPDCLACALFPQSDGSWIASQVGKNGDVNVFRISSSGQSPPRRVSASFNGRTYGLWPIPTPDGKYLYGFLNREADRKGAPDRSFIYRLRLTD